MKIHTPFTSLPKYFNAFNNYFENADEKLVSYTYISEDLKKTTLKNSKTLGKNQLNNNLTDNK